MVLLLTGWLPIMSVSADDGGLTRAGDVVNVSGPWFVGDAFELSVLVHNNASHDESASMKLNFSGTEVQGSQQLLIAGNSAELRVGHTLTESGTVDFLWSVLDSDAEVSFQGASEILVEPSQSLDVEAVSVAHDADAGFSLTWKATLSSGKQRQVAAMLSFAAAGESTGSLTIDVLLEPGERTLTHTLGQAPTDAESIRITLMPEGWLAVGVSTDSTSIESAASGLGVQITGPLDPVSPAIGEAVDLDLEFANTGALDVGTGRLILIDGQKRLLAEIVTDSVASGTTRNIEIRIESWMSTSTTTLTVEWHIAGRILSDELEVVSANSVSPSESDSIDVPWGDVLVGVLAALGVVMSLRMVTVWRSRPTEPARRFSRRNAELKASQAPTSDEKRDIFCPACDRALRVPTDYSGQVKCPSCRVQFSAVSDSSSAETSPSVEIESTPEPEHELSGSSLDDIIGCPNCDQVLRVPYDKRPAKARCPSCRTIFHALAE